MLRQKAKSPAGSLGHSPPAAMHEKNVGIVWHKTIENFTSVNTSMIPIKQFNDHLHTYSYIVQYLQFITDNEHLPL